ncbi:MAG: TonB-dependent receptor [Betaproteobacteria bacterium]
MKFRKSKVAVALGFGVGGGMLLAAVGVHAQDAPAPAAPQADIRVEVTGSNIKRVEGEGALPVTVMTRKDIERTGATTPMELLQFISANTSAGNVSIGNVIGTLSFSTQTASLRGLGGGRTLVLINGKRVDGTAGEVQGVQGVNLAVIPFAAIERVEVLKDGASAIYGSDAIGGVINFILRQDYRGGEGFVQYGSPTRKGGGDQYLATGSVGFGDLAKDRYNAFFSLSYTQQNSLDQNQRNFSKTSFLPDIGLLGISGNTFPGYISTGGIGSVGYPNNCGAANIAVTDPTLVGILGARCVFDPSQVSGVQMIPDDKLWNFFGSGRFQINRDWQAYVTGLYSRDQTRFQIQPVPISDQFTYGPNNDIFSNVTLPPTSPFYPHDLAIAAGVDGQPLNVRYRAVESGLRNTTDTNENAQIVAGLKGTWKQWDWDGSFFYSEGRTNETLNGGFPRYSLLLPLLNSGNVNLFGPNTPDISAQIQAANYNGTTFDGTSKNYGVEGKTTGTLWQLPAGPMALAVGGEVRKESLDQVPNAVLATGDVAGYGGNVKDVNASRNIWAAYAELNVPILKSLEGDVAVRYEHYSDFGSTTNPKVSLRWQPSRAFLMRGSYGTGFVAPSLYQLFTPQIGGASPTGLSDPIRCPVTANVGIDCSTQFNVTFGGNPALKPERAEQWSAGGVWEPVPGASLSADYFKINLSGAITNGIPITTILADLGQYGGLVQRGPVDPNFPALPGRIEHVLQTYINLGNLHIEGLDVDLQYQTPQTAYGRFAFGLSGTYYIRYDAQATDGSYVGGVGTVYGAVTTGVIPRWKNYASVTWTQGPWSATVANTYQSSYVDASTDLNGNFRRVGTLSLWDLQGGYSGFKNLTLTLGVKNVFDTNPPVTNQQNTFQLGFDTSYYDPRARFVYGSIRYAFR